jgi:hypothetical protein
MEGNLFYDNSVASIYLKQYSSIDESDATLRVVDVLTSLYVNGSNNKIKLNSVVANLIFNWNGNEIEVRFISKIRLSPAH